VFSGVVAVTRNDRPLGVIDRIAELESTIVEQSVEIDMLAEHVELLSSMVYAVMIICCIAIIVTILLWVGAL
jgi:hypothetical protein